MFVHPYHFQLMRCCVRQKVKGDYRLQLTCADRMALVENLNLKVSKGYIVKVLSEGDRKITSLSQYVLDQLAHAIDYADWNAFLRENPVPNGKYEALLKSTAQKVLNALVEQRMVELCD